jgi:GntR family transcriptional regulator / MocR family aminotransferase
VTASRAVSVSSADLPRLSAIADSGQRHFICRGCYFIYEELADLENLEQAGIEPGTLFPALPAECRCPDCGTEKSTFRPYLGLTSGIS